MRRRSTPDGLPFRLYERYGSRVYSIGYKKPDNTWEFRLSCPARDHARIMETRREAIRQFTELQTPTPLEVRTFGWLCDRWLEFQERLPINDGAKRKASTLAENKREIATLKKVFGNVRLSDITHVHGVQYLDACALAQDEDGNPRPRIEKGNKEIILAKVIFRFGKDRGWIGTNPFIEVEKREVIKAEGRYVTDKELEIVLDAGRQMGGPYHIMALCFQAAYLCYRRSVEARSLTRDMLKDKGILWTNGKQKAGEKPKQVLIDWSPELRACIDEALACKRHPGISTFYVFGNMSGKRYTKGGWKANLVRLMARAEEMARAKGVSFQKFSLQECRPKAVSDELEANNYDVQAVMNATLHTTPRQIDATYDRKRVRRAKPVSKTDQHADDAGSIPNLEYGKAKGASQ